MITLLKVECVTTVSFAGSFTETIFHDAKASAISARAFKAVLSLRQEVCGFLTVQIRFYNLTITVYDPRFLLISVATYVEDRL